MKDVNEVFIPLNTRITDFEITEFPVSLEAEEYSKIIHPIKEGMGLLDHKEMLSKSLLFNGRVLELLIDLPLREQEYMNKNNWRNELSFYLRMLDKVQGYLIQFSKNEKCFASDFEFEDVKFESINIINLPENFTVKNITKDFAPKLSPNQTVLLLSLLREGGVLPPYSDSSLGKLGEAFFARNQKTITKGLTDIHSLKKNKEDITVLKSLLQDILNKL